MKKSNSCFVGHCSYKTNLLQCIIVKKAKPLKNIMYFLFSHFFITESCATK